jgi:hypothetical protein
MIDYISFQYIFPPRPKNPIPPKDLSIWDNSIMMAQPKINGSNCTIYMNGKDMFVYNRHGQRLTGFDISKQEVYSLYRGRGWMVLNGEFTNKGKTGFDNQPFQNKFCIFDILVKDNQYLIGKTFSQRYELLCELYGLPCEYLHKINDNLFLIQSFYDKFEEHYNKLIKIDMIEGLVLKRKSAKLEVGSTELNNYKSQIKVRKPTKNYKF